MEKVKNEGIILKNTAFKETSLIAHLITSEGKKSLLFKGVKKMNGPFRCLSNPITLISYIPSRAALPTIIDGDLLDNFSFIKEDLTGNLYASHMTEIAYYLLDSDIDQKKLYLFLLKCLKKMDKGDDSEVICFVFELKCLFLIGVGPNFNHCISCGESEPYQFDINLGGALCSKCGHKSTPSLSKIIELYRINLDTESLPFLTIEERKNIRNFIDQYYKMYVGIKTKSHLFIPY